MVSWSRAKETPTSALQHLPFGSGQIQLCMYSFCLGWLYKWIVMDTGYFWTFKVNQHCRRKCETTASRATPSPTTPCWTPARNAAAWRKPACCWKICVRRVLTPTSSPIPPSSRAIAWQVTRWPMAERFRQISPPGRHGFNIQCGFDVMTSWLFQYSSHHWIVLICMFTLHCFFGCFTCVCCETMLTSGVPRQTLVMFLDVSRGIIPKVLFQISEVWNIMTYPYNM